MKGEGIRRLLFGLGFGWRGRLTRNAALTRGVTLTLALSHEGRGDPLAAVRTWFGTAGAIARNAALGRGGTLTLALSRKGRGDPLVGTCT